jgi:hypothetical protein
MIEHLEVKTMKIGKYFMPVFVMLVLVSSVFADYATPGNPAVIAVGSASIDEGVGTSPVVEYVWVLPDESLDTDTQVMIEPSGERCDIYACLVVSDVESRDTIEDVFVDIYHPDESFKYQMHATWLDPNDSAEAAEIEACKTDALAAGLISSQDFDDINYNIFNQPNWYMYKVYLPMYYHQPSGWYDVYGYAVDSTSRLSQPNVEEFEWVAGTYLELDFNTINFGNIQPGAWKIVNGDVDMNTPNMPTLKNEGNTEVVVGVEFSKFVGQASLPNKIIDDFDAQLRNIGTNNYLGIPGEHLEFVAEQQVWFTHPISLCRQEKIDFSIHADVGTVPDQYAGSVTIYAEPNVVDAPVPDMEYPVEGSCDEPND